MIPFFSFLNLLWTRPKNWKREQSVDPDTTKAFDKAKRIATMTSGITGGIESPIQFALQVGHYFLQLSYDMKLENWYFLPMQIYLMLNGHLPSLWSGLNYSEFKMKDWFDNEIVLPRVASLSLAFSLANMIKAAIHLNVYKTYGTERKFPTHQVYLFMLYNISHSFQEAKCI